MKKYKSTTAANKRLDELLRKAFLLRDLIKERKQLSCKYINVWIVEDDFGIFSIEVKS